MSFKVILKKRDLKFNRKNFSFTCEPCLLNIGKKCMGCQIIKKDLKKCQKCENQFCQKCEPQGQFICGHHSCSNCN